MIWFPCRHCHANLCGDAAAAGTRHLCPRCGKHTPTPPHSLPPAPDENDLASRDDLPPTPAEYRRRLRATFRGRVPPEFLALGELRWFGACRRPPAWLVVLWGGVPVVAGLLLLTGLFGFEDGFWDIINVREAWGLAVWAGVALVAYGLWALWRCRGRASCALALGAEGFVCRMGGDTLRYRWDELREVWLRVGPASPALDTLVPGGDTRRVRHFRWVMADGREVVLPPELPGLEDVAPLLRGPWLRHRYPPLAAQLEAGEPVDFGPLMRLEPDGLVCRRSLLPWDELDSVEVNDAVVEVFARGMSIPWHSVPAAEVPNVAVLIDLANETAERRRAPGK